MKPYQLLNLFTCHFNMDELVGLCFDLDVKHEEIPGHNQTLSVFARNLVLFFESKNGLPKLIERCRELRPEASWPDNDSLPNFSAWDEAAIDDKELENYLGWIQTQYSTIRVLGMKQPLSLENVYTDVFLSDESENRQKQEIEYLEQAFVGRKDREQKGKRIQGGELLAQANRFFIEGQPGAGKTMFSKWLALKAAQNYVEKQRIPFYLVLRRFNTWDDSLLALLAHELEFGNIAAATKKLRELLRQGKLLILLDGLDEVLAEQRDVLNDQIADLVKWSDENQIVITCRPHAEPRGFEHFEYVRMADFRGEQVERFVRQWFDDSNLANSLLRELKRAEHGNIRELTRTPLLLVLLCIGYGHEPYFPKRKHQLYERALQVVLKQWDEERGVKRESVYGQLPLEKKQALLAHVAYATFSQGQLFIAEEDLAQHIVDFWQDWRQEEINRQKAEYGQVYPPELPPKEIVPQEIIREISAQHGLLAEQLEGIYSFSHLTLQEYFVALYVVKNEKRGSVEQLMLFVGDDRWRELFLLTAGMLVSPTEFFELFLEVIDQIVANDDQLLACLKWAEDKGTQTPLPYKSAATRAFLFDYALSFTFALPCTLDEEIDSVVDRAVNVARALVRALDPGLDIARTLATNYTLSNLPRDRDTAVFFARSFVQGRARDIENTLHILSGKIDSMLQVSDLLGLKEMQATLQELAVPEVQATVVPEEFQAYFSTLVQILDKYQNDWDPYQKVQLDKQELDKQEIEPFVGLKLFDEQFDKLILFFIVNELLVRCLEVAHVPNRQAIEDRILLPPSS